MAPCEWEIEVGCYSDWAGFPDDVKARATAWATEILWALSGRRYGTCEIVVRPCATCATPTYQTYGVWWQGVTGGSWVPYLLDGVWLNCGCGLGPHTCRPDSEIPLPGPVDSIVEVRVDGQVVPSAAYRVDDHTWLVRQDGAAWPQHQDLSLPPGQPDTFTVTYKRGVPVPLGGKVAAGALAHEYALACTGGACRLPANVQSIVRQGVEMQVVPEDPADMLTGVPEADQWLRAVNPDKLRQRPQVASLDVNVPRVTTWG